MAKTVEVSQTVGGANEWRRARRPEHKLVRKEAILSAARYLVDTGGVEGTTLSDIARQANLSKANCYRYFENREAVLLQVVLEETRDWTDAIVDGLSRLSRNGNVRVVSELLVSETLKRPRLCELISSMWTVLEQNVSADVLADFKHEFRKVASQWTTALVEVLPKLSEDQAKQFSLFFLLFIGSAWPACKVSPVMEQLMLRKEFANLKVDLKTTLHSHTVTLLKGLLTP